MLADASMWPGNNLRRGIWSSLVSQDYFKLSRDLSGWARCYNNRNCLVVSAELMLAPFIIYIMSLLITYLNYCAPRWWLADNTGVGRTKKQNCGYDRIHTNSLQSFCFTLFPGFLASYMWGTAYSIKGLREAWGAVASKPGRKFSPSLEIFFLFPCLPILY